MFKIYTAISGGVTGYRDSYVKDENGEVLLFETEGEACAHAAQLRANRSAHSRFNQIWEVVEE